MKQVSLSIALAICAFASAQNFYAREWTPNSSFDVLELDVNNDGVADFTSGSNDINTLHTNAFLGTYVANPSKIKYLRFNESVGPNNTELSWVGEGIGNYRYDENALSISETQNRTYPLTGENYYYVAYNNNHNVVYPFKVGNRYGFFIFTKN